MQLQDFIANNNKKKNERTKHLSDFILNRSFSQIVLLQEHEYKQYKKPYKFFFESREYFNLKR
jgi:hypothetical protein